MAGGHISDAVVKDHQEILACYNRIVSSTDRDEQVRFQNLFTWDLARLLVAEELVVYPALEKHLPEGAAMAEKNRKAHQTVSLFTIKWTSRLMDYQVKEELKTFQNLDPSNDSFIPAIQALMKDMSQHVQDEETNDLLQLESVLTDDQSDHLRKSFNRTKIFMPSRAHPHAPNKPPFETAVGLLTAPFDQLGDLLRKWPQHA
jgi:hemerythrin-like domain-containing protein